MVASVVRGEARQYYVGVVWYYVDGTPSAATGLSLNKHLPSDIVLANDRITCTAFVQPQELDMKTVVANGMAAMKFAGRIVDFVPLRVEVKLIDIWAVAEFIKGQQHDLFLDPETVRLRLTAFPSKAE